MRLVAAAGLGLALAGSVACDHKAPGPADSGSATARPPASTSPAGAQKVIDRTWTHYVEVGKLIDAAKGDCEKLGQPLTDYVAQNGAEILGLLAQGGGADSLHAKMSAVVKEFDALDEKFVAALGVDCATNPEVKAAAATLGY